MKLAPGVILFLGLVSINSFAYAADSQLEADPGPVQQLKSTTSFGNEWYVSSFARTINQDFDPLADKSENGLDLMLFSGGYQYQVLEKVAIFMEAGVASQYTNEAIFRGYNLSTGVSYNLGRKIRVESKLQTQDTEYSHTSLEFSGSYKIVENLDLKASLDMGEKTNQMKFGIGYRF